MEIGDVLPLPIALDRLPEGARRWSADPSGAQAGSIRLAGNGDDVGLVGPSGGWSEAEAERIRNLDFSAICLSDARLRTETAAMAWAFWWSAGADTASQDLVPEEENRRGLGGP
jgi:16S rRNA U1498 N3-methylase RsmE